MVVEVDSRPVEGEARLSNEAGISLGGCQLHFALAEPVPGGRRLQEAIAWLFVAGVVAAELWLIRWLS
jgi:hypothetical protein